MAKSSGEKFDQDKARWDLLPMECVEEIVKVLGHGAKKYDDFNWQLVDNLSDRYYAAALRHMVAWRKGEIIDTESGLNHLAHVGCCILFMLWEDLKNGRRADKVCSVKRGSSKRG